MLHKSFKPAKCKTALNLAKSRMKLMKNKKDVQMKQSRREVAQLLQSGQDQTARIRVEHVVREEKTIAAYEMIEIYCELIVARLPIIESQKVCPLDLKEAITSLIFAAPRCADIPELQDVRKHFTAKYGKEFVAAATELRPACGVSRTLIEKLSVKAPDGPLKVKILKGIAEEHNIQWEPNWFKDDPISSDYTVEKIPHTDNSNTTQIQQQQQQQQPQPQPSNTIQMKPLNAKIADDLEEKHSHMAKQAEVSAQRLAHANINETQSSSTSRPDFRPSGNVSGGMLSSQSSGTAQSSFSVDRQHWNMEFKDATAAARAAAESAERASMAARAAAELSIRDSYRPGLSSVHGENDSDGRYAGSVLHHKHEQGNPVNSSFDQRSPRMERHQRTTSQHSDIIGGRDGRSSNTHSQSEVPYDTRQQEFRESESTSNRVSADTIRQSTASASIQSSSKGDYYSSTSSKIQEYEAEPAENPFYGETVEPLNRPSQFYSQSSGYEDEYGAFSNAKYDEIDSDSSFVVLGQGTSEEDNWHAKTTYLSNSNSIKDETIYRDYGERNVFEKSDEQRYGFDSGTGVFAGMDQEPSGLDINDKVGHHVANAVFDDSCSDDDEELILDPAGEVKSPSGDFSPRHGLPRKDNPYFEPDLSESFRKSPIYSKLIEPLPVTFDDYDAPSPKSEKELQTENSEPDIGSYNYRKPDWDSDATTEFIGSSFVEKTDDSFLSSKKMEDNQKAHVGTIGRGKDSESLRSLRLSSESKDHPEFDDETHSSSDEGGVELNLGSLPGGRRNKPSWGSPYSRDKFAGVSSPSRYSEAAASGGVGKEEDSEQGSMPYKGRSNHKSVFAPPPLNTTERTERGTIHENVHKTRAKDPTGYFEYDDKAPEENAAKPAINKNLQGAGISRRTRGSARLVSSRPSRNLGDATKTGQFSSSSYATDDSPKSRHRSSAQSSLKDDTTSELRSETKLSRNSNSSPLDIVEQPATPESPRISRASVSSEKAPSRENSGKLPSHVHPKLPDFETFTAHLQSLRTNRQ